MKNAKCKYCTYSDGDIDPEFGDVLICNLTDLIVDPNDECESFEREPVSDDGDK